jgi:hypothetical protein
MCYFALGIIHNLWRPIPGQFDDYIASPKDNFYQSLHTAVLYDDGKTLEVQIRTPEMHENAEYGIAAHWRYKEGGRRDEAYEKRINWLRGLMDWRQDLADAGEFVDAMKRDVFEDRVYAFTPHGDIIDLPAAPRRLIPASRHTGRRPHRGARSTASWSVWIITSPRLWEHPHRQARRAAARLAQPPTWPARSQSRPAEDSPVFPAPDRGA